MAYHLLTWQPFREHARARCLSLDDTFINQSYRAAMTVKVSSSGLRQPAGDSLNDLDPAGRYTRLWVSVGSEAMPAWANLPGPGTLQSKPVPCETPQITA